ncbi:hypothetical protein [Hoeflea sp.]|uniref:hypothetical protein n=1 Tax=Hoeflea sp. TaxID=1940281 RepID=UPI003B01D641
MLSGDVLKLLKKTALSTVFSLAIVVGAGAQDVSYQDILNNPDDLELNYLYAQQQVIKGDLEQAAAALERLLLLQPNWDNARLFYALVLYRLDDMAGAKRELTLLTDRPLSASQKREVNRYLALASAQSKSTRLTGRIAVGTRVDSNPDLTTSSDVDLNGTPLDTNTRVDGAFTAGTMLRLESDLPGGAGNFGFVQLNSNLNEQFSVDEADYITARVRAGASLFYEDLQITPYGVAQILALGGQVYRTDYGGGARAKYTISPQVSVFVGGEGVFQNYEVVSDDSVGSARNGPLATAIAGVTVRPSERNRITARVSGYFKDARNDSYSYDAIEIALNSLWLLGQGQYVLASASYRVQDYDQPDPNYSATVTREDQLFKARLAYGLPLDVMLENLNITPAEVTSNVNFQVGVNYLNQDSNIPNFVADSVSADIMLIKRFAN